MDFSDQLCFRKLLTVLHRFLKTLFIMKSTKTIFAISSIRCIKPLNSSSSCSPEQVYFSKKQKQNKKNKKKKSKIFIKYNDAKKKKKRERKRKLQFSGYAQRPRRLIQVHDRIFVVLFILCLICLFFFRLYEMGFLKFRLSHCAHGVLCLRCVCRCDSVSPSMSLLSFPFFFFRRSVTCLILFYEFQFALTLLML